VRVFCITVAIVVAAAASGCGGSDKEEKEETGPLTVSERVLRLDEIDGFILTKRAQVRTSADAFFDDVNFFPAPEGKLPELRMEIERAGFVAGAVEELGAENNGEGGGGSIVVQLESPQFAKTIVQDAYEASVSPCPGVCNIDFSEFEVEGVPGAKGSGRLRSEEAASPGSPSFEGYEVFFSDGAFLYVLYTEGRPGDVTSDDLADAARNLYERVAGRPAAGGSSA
jgi:hypothetical protein